jgi:hypothetical protein
MGGFHVVGYENWQDCNVNELRAEMQANTTDVLTRGDGSAARQAELARDQAPAWPAVASNYVIYFPFWRFRAIVYFTYIPRHRR